MVDFSDTHTRTHTHTHAQTQRVAPPCERRRCMHQRLGQIALLINFEISPSCGCILIDSINGKPKMLQDSSLRPLHPAPGQLRPGGPLRHSSDSRCYPRQSYCLPLLLLLLSFLFFFLMVPPAFWNFLLVTTFCSEQIHRGNGPCRVFFLWLLKRLMWSYCQQDRVLCPGIG